MSLQGQGGVGERSVLAHHSLGELDPVHNPTHHPKDPPGAYSQGTVSFSVSNIPSVGEENDICKGANCSCLSKVQESAKRVVVGGTFPARKLLLAQPLQRTGPR